MKDRTLKITTAIGGGDRLLGERGDEQADAPRDAKHSAEVERGEQRPAARPSPKPICVPDSRVRSPAPKRATPTTAPATVTSSVAASENDRRSRAYLTASSRVRSTGTVEQVAQRADVGLAGDGVAGETPTASGRNRPSSTLERGERDEQAVVGDRGEEVRPAAPGAGCGQLDRDGHERSARRRARASPARLRRRPKMSRSSERRKRRAQPRCGRRRPAAREAPGATAGATSAADIEALPRE